MGIKLMLELLFKNLALFLTDKNYRKFIFLILSLGSKERNKIKYTKLMKHPFKIADNLSFIWQFKEIFVDESYYFTTSSKTPIIFDCGTNIGLSVIYFKYLYPNSTVVGFEPDPAIYSIAKENILEFNLMDVDLKNEAIWINNEIVQFNSSGADSGSISQKGSKDLIEVKAIKLSSLLSAIKEVNMLKMDIEGAEIEVLKDCGNLLHKVENIFIEYHSSIGSPQELGDLLHLLQQSGFRYTLNTPNFKNKPISLIGRNIGNGFDLQVNVFATKRNIN